ncbi:MAG TPA: amidohydrolase family protein [Blastocatellia bacterium]|nr:amidohydrolase family protein [Blastocatellia bacterium]HMZ18654.1 amidohydrolase family protein [Blastocatellia bacterium]HNG32941.1 amidohydrolase family protein [Blastocatellia bacterium]
MFQSAALATAAFASARPIPVIDTHTHFYDTARAQGVPWPPPSEPVLYKPHFPPEFQTLTKTHGVVGTVVVEASPWVEDNQWILNLAKDNPFIVGFIGNLELGKPEFAANLNRFGANPVFRGLRVNGRALGNGLGQSAFEKDLQALGERKYAMDVVGDGAMLPNVVRAAKLAPGLRIVIDHLPFGEWDKDVPAMQRVLAEAAQLPNVYAKVSNVVRRLDGKVIEAPESYRPALDALWKLFGAERLIFGSNWPVSNRVAPYAALHKIVADYFAARGQSAAEKYFWKNSLAAYGWIARGEARRLKK